MPPKTKTRSATGTKLALATAALLAASSLALATLPVSEKDKDTQKKEATKVKQIVTKSPPEKTITTTTTRKQPTKKILQTNPPKLQKYCDTDDQCGENQICENWKCREIEKKYCINTDQCDKNQVCENSRCREIERMKIITIRRSDDTNYRPDNNVSIGQGNNSSNTRPVTGPTGGSWWWFSGSRNTSENFYNVNWIPYTDGKFVMVTITGDIEEQTLSFLADVEDRHGNVQVNKRISIYLPEIDTENPQVPCDVSVERAGDSCRELRGTSPGDYLQTCCSPLTFANQAPKVNLIIDEFGSTYYIPVNDASFQENEEGSVRQIDGRIHYTNWQAALSEENLARRGLVPHNNTGFQIRG